MKKYLFLIHILLCCLLVKLSAQRVFTHPGLTYTQADLDRMRTMVAAKQEPYYKTYLELVKSSYSKIGDGNYESITQIEEGRFNATIGRDGRRAHDRALLYHLTGNEAYADDVVKILNRYNTLTNTSSRGTGPLDNGKLYLLLEAAELLRDYEGWQAEDQAAFKKMLVHPYYSTTRGVENHQNWTDDSLNNVTFYWNICNFDAARWGNQGLFAARSLLAMGVFLDNDTIYDRAYRYLNALPARADDLPYSTLANIGSEKSNNGFYIEYNRTGSNGDFIADEALKYYIYKNGQCQEACRDQGHVLAGIGNYTAIAEIAWNQGDALYSALDNRILLGVEYALRHNLSATQSFEEQSTRWMPIGYSERESDCTFENGLFYRALSRSNRWKALQISEDAELPEAWITQVYQHYKVRAGLSRDKYLWLESTSNFVLERDNGVEDWGVSPNWFYEWTGWGTLTKQRTEWMAGNPGTWKNNQWVSGMPTAPTTIKAVDYDYYLQNNGEGFTYHNKGTAVQSSYRSDQTTVEIQKVNDDYVVNSVENGEWLSYTFAVSDSGKYDIYVTYQATSQGKLAISVDNGEWIENICPTSEEFKEVKIGQILLGAGASVLRLKVTGSSNVLILKEIRIASSDYICPVVNHTTSMCYNKLAEAVEAANPDDVLIINADQYISSRLNIPKNLTLKAGVDHVTIRRDASYTNGLLFLPQKDGVGNNTTLTFDANGKEFVIDGGNLICSACTLEASNGCSIVMNGVSLQNIISTNNQGVISVKNSGRLTIENTQFNHCEVLEERSIIFNGAKVFLKGSNIFNNCSGNIFIEKLYYISSADLKHSTPINITLDDIDNRTQKKVVDSCTNPVLFSLTNANYALRSDGVNLVFTADSTTDIDETSKPYHNIWSSKNAICINSETIKTIDVFSVDGSFVQKKYLLGGLNTIDALQAGLYIVNGKKIVVY